MDGLKIIGIAQINGRRWCAGNPVPFLGLDRFPPGNGQADFVAAGHKDMFMIGKSMIPNPDTVRFFWWASWESMEKLDQFAKLRFREGMLQSKDAIRGAAALPQTLLEAGRIIQTMIIYPVMKPFIGLAGPACCRQGLA